MMTSIPVMILKNKNRSLAGGDPRSGGDPEEKEKTTTQHKIYHKKWYTTPVVYSIFFKNRSLVASGGAVQYVIVHEHDNMTVVHGPFYFEDIALRYQHKLESFYPGDPTKIAPLIPEKSTPTLHPHITL